MPSHPYINKKVLKNVIVYPEDKYRKMYFEKYPHEKEDKAFRFINRSKRVDLIDTRRVPMQ